MRQKYNIKLNDYFKNISILKIHGIIIIGADNKKILFDEKLINILNVFEHKIKNIMHFLDINIENKLLEKKIVLFANKKIIINNNFINILSKNIDEMINELYSTNDHINIRVNIDGMIISYSNIVSFRIINSKNKLIGEIINNPENSYKNKLNEFVKSISLLIKKVNIFFKEIISKK